MTDETQREAEELAEFDREAAARYESLLGLGRSTEERLADFDRIKAVAKAAPGETYRAILDVIVEAIAPAWVATQAELEDEARLVLDGLTAAGYTLSIRCPRCEVVVPRRFAHQALDDDWEWSCTPAEKGGSDDRAGR